MLPFLWSSFRFTTFQEMAIIDLAFNDELVVDQFLAHVGQELHLLLKKFLEACHVQFPPSSLGLTQRPKLVSDALFEYLHSVFTVLKVKFGQVRDGPNGSQHRIIRKAAVSRSETCHHGDPLRHAQRSQRLMFDVAA